MALFLFMVGAVFGVLFIVNNILRTVQRRKNIARGELTLAFFVVLLPVTALLMDNTGEARFDLLEQSLFLLIIPLFITSIAFTVIEGFRPQGWRQSRGVFGMGLALILLSANFSFSFVSNFFQSTRPQPRIPTPVNALTIGQDPCDFEVLFNVLTNELFDLISEYSGLTPEELAVEFERSGAKTLGELVSENDQDPDAFADDLIGLFDELIDDAVGNDCFSPLEGAAARAFIAPQLRELADADFDTLIQGFTGGGFFGGGGGQSDDTVVELSEAELQGTRAALAAFIPTLAAGTDLPTVTPTPTITLTPTPTITRTPRPTATPLPTIERFMTSTPTLTPTLPNPCLATANFNVNMRDFPDLDESDILITIPWQSAFQVFYSNLDRTWWFGQFEGEAGWISAEFISLTRNCDDLPQRRP